MDEQVDTRNARSAHSKLNGRSKKYFDQGKMMMNRNKNVLLIDIPTYKVELPDLHRSIIEKRLVAQTFLWEQRTGHKMIRPALTYSRGLLTIASCLVDCHE